MKALTVLQARQREFESEVGITRKMTADSFRIGIIGCGKIAHRHVQACLRSSELAVGQLVDASRERAEQLAAQYRLNVPIASTVHEIAGNVDGIIIATPNDTHAPIAKECIEARLPVLIEKPLATTVADGEQICQLAKERQVVVAVGYTTRFRKNVQLFRSMLESAEFGTVERFVYQYGSRGGWSPISGYNLDRQATGGGVLVSTGSHFLDRLIYWFGYPDDVALQDDSLGGPEANAHAHFRYDRQKGEMTGLALFSRTVSLKPRFVAQTDRGLVFLDDDPNASIRFRPDHNPVIDMTINAREEHCNGSDTIAADAFQLQLEDFVDACRRGHSPKVSARDGLKSLYLIEQLYALRAPMPAEWYPTLTAGVSP